MTKAEYVRSLVAVLVVWMLASVFITGGEESRWHAEAESNTNAVAAQHRQPMGVGHPSFVSPHASPIAVSDNSVFVVNTPSDTLDVIDAKTNGNGAEKFWNCGDIKVIKCSGGRGCPVAPVKTTVNTTNTEARGARTSAAGGGPRGAWV